jgi:biotin operon repressor
MMLTRPHRLTPFQERILGHLATGLSRRQTADLLGIRRYHVDNHLRRLRIQGIHIGIPPLVYRPLTYELARDPDFYLPWCRAVTRAARGTTEARFAETNTQIRPTHHQKAA